MYLLNSIHNLIAVEFKQLNSKGAFSDTPSMASTYFLKRYMDGIWTVEIQQTSDNECNHNHHDHD
jgi:hypothetical protein